MFNIKQTNYDYQFKILLTGNLIRIYGFKSNCCINYTTDPFQILWTTYNIYRN